MLSVLPHQPGLPRTFRSEKSPSDRAQPAIARRGRIPLCHKDGHDPRIDGCDHRRKGAPVLHVPGVDQFAGEQAVDRVDIQTQIDAFDLDGPCHLNTLDCPALRKRQFGSDRHIAIGRETGCGMSSTGYRSGNACDKRFQADLPPVAPRHLGEFDGTIKARFGEAGDIAAAQAEHDAKTGNALLAGGVVAVLLLAIALLAPEASHAALTLMGRAAA